MYQRRTFPTRFPASGSMFGKDIVFADEATLRGYIGNKRQLDRDAVLGWLGTRGSDAPPVTVDEIKTYLRAGETWNERQEFEPDGSKRECSACGKLFQPVEIPWKTNDGRSGIGGNFFVRKIIEVEKYLAKYADEAFKSVYLAIHDELTTEALGEGVELPMTVRAATACQKCREVLRKETRIRFMAFSSLADELQGAQKGIASAMSRTAFIESSTRRRTTDNRQRDNRGGNNGGYRGHGQRTRGPRKVWNGVQYFPNVTDKLDQLVQSGELENSLEGLLAKSPQELEVLGVDNPGTVLELAQKHQDWKAREARKTEIASRGSVTLGEVAETNRR